ncbi:hypothetical protein NKG60_28280 [Mesorhizobium sp. M1428]|uniref:hypothetical protein n=1 Tax=Mesorhizobium sp. M1428 TaxID=2957102 RepID=UPI00333B4D00
MLASKRTELLPIGRHKIPKRATGRYESVTAGAENVDAFIPFDLPPARPALFVEGKLEYPLREAEQALVRLDLAGDMVP